MGLFAILLWIAWCCLIAICVAALFVIAPDTPEDDAHGITHGDSFPVPPPVHGPGDTP